MYRNTITYRYAVFAGIFTVSAAILAILDLMPHNDTFAYGVLLPLELLVLPALGMCGIALLIMDLIFKKHLQPAKFNNKFLIGTEWVLIAGYVSVSGYFILETFLSCFNNNPAEGFSILGIYFTIGAILAIVIRFITFFTQKFSKK